MNKQLYWIAFAMTIVVLLLSWHAVKETLPLGFVEWSWYYHANKESVLQICLFALGLIGFIWVWWRAFANAKTLPLKWLVLMGGSGLIIYFITYSFYKVLWM